MVLLVSNRARADQERKVLRDVHVREGDRTIEFANDRLRLTFEKATGRRIEFRTKEMDGTDVIALVSLSAKPERVVILDKRGQGRTSPVDRPRDGERHGSRAEHHGRGDVIDGGNGAVSRDGGAPAAMTRAGRYAGSMRR
jgi:hypothetical protein